MSEYYSLQDFVRTKATLSQIGTENHIDWDARINNWQAAINNLYNIVRCWLQPLEDDGTVRYLRSTVTINEEHVENYKVEVLSVLIGSQRIAFHPKGTFIIGADGRIDVRGQRAVRTLVLNDNEWFVVERTPQVKTLPFNEDSFQDLLREVME